MNNNLLHKISNSIVSDFIFRIITENFSFIFSIITFSLISRMLEKEEYAIVNQTLTLSSVVAPIILLQLNSTFCVFLAPLKDKQTQISRFISMLLLIIPVCVVFWLSMAIKSNFMSSLLFASDSYDKYLILIATYLVFYSLSFFSIEFFRGLTRLKTSTFFVMLRTILITSCLLILVYITKSLSLYTVLMCYCLVEFSILFIVNLYILYVFFGTKIVINFYILKDYFLFAIPLIPYAIMSWANAGLSRIILNHLMSLKDAAIYGFNYSVVVRVFFLNSLIGYIIYPYISRFWAEKNLDKVKSYLSNGINMGILLYLPLTVGVIVTAPTIVAILAKGNFVPNRILIAIISLSMFFQFISNIFSYLIALSRKTIWYNFILLAVCVINISVLYVAIPLFGIYGAAIALAVTYFFQALLTSYIGIKNTGLTLNINFIFIFKTIICTLIMSIILVFIYNNTGAINFMMSFIASVLCYFMSLYFVSKFTNTNILS